MILPFTAKRKAAVDSLSSDNEDDLLADLLSATPDAPIDPAADEDAEEYELDADREAADNEDIESVIAEIEREYELTPEEVRLGRTAVTKVRKYFLS